MCYHLRVTIIGETMSVYGLKREVFADINEKLKNLEKNKNQLSDEEFELKHNEILNEEEKRINEIENIYHYDETINSYFEHTPKKKKFISKNDFLKSKKQHNRELQSKLKEIDSLAPHTQYDDETEQKLEKRKTSKTVRKKLKRFDANISRSIKNLK